MKNYLILLLVILIGMILIVYHELTCTHISVMFPELRPIENAMPVYYKGLIIGKARESRHSNDYHHTIIKIVLYPKNINLPINTEVYLKQIVKNKKSHDFLELIYPKTPSKTLIFDGVYLKGNSTVDMESYYKSIPEDDLTRVKESLVQSSENLNLAIEGLSQLFEILQSTIDENRRNIQTSTKNISRTTENIKRSSDKINNSIQQQKLEKIINDVEGSLNNLNSTTQNIYSSSLTLNSTMPAINASASDAQNTLANVSSITCGIRRTLSKPFGGLRLIFGKTIDE